MFKRSESASRAEQRHLEQLDMCYRKAQEALLAEEIRGHLIDWRNNFARLQRVIAANPNDFGEEYPLFVGKSFWESAFFASKRKANESKRLMYALPSMKKKIEERILSVAYVLGYSGGSVEKAIAILARGGHLNAVVQYIDELEESIKVDDAWMLP